MSITPSNLIRVRLMFTGHGRTSPFGVWEPEFEGPIACFEAHDVTEGLRCLTKQVGQVPVITRGMLGSADVQGALTECTVKFLDALGAQLPLL